MCNLILLTFYKLGEGGVWHSTEVAFVLLTQLPWVEIPAWIFFPRFSPILLSLLTVESDQIHLVQARDFTNAESGKGQS